MAKTYIRVDDRLIHGQTIVAWCPTLSINEIIAIDDISASDSMLKNILTMGVPKEYNANILTIDEAKEKIKEESNNNRLIIVKSIEKLIEIKNVINNTFEIFLGNMSKRDDTNHQIKEATGIFYLSDKDIEDVNILVKDGFKVIFQQLPNKEGKKWEEGIKKI
ncbi:MAG: PTS sugar transporter subunit IIB [Eubacteriales bacterium]|nr:PTS sugar transporter subunit IIB [Eubacteriales bacterium]